MTNSAKNSDLIGRTIDDRYELLETLGRGSAGTVYRALQLAVEREVAIKIMHPQLAMDQDFGRRFELEAKAVARLDHPCIITLHDFGFCSKSSVHYMVTELVEGDPLSHWTRGRADISVPDILSIAIQVAEALSHAHEKDVLHRDMKPANIMVRRTQYGGVRAKILDFGLAQLREHDKSEWDLTKPGQVHGTPLYMSPEQALGKRDLNPAADMYAFGILFYEMFEGRPPFYASSVNDMLQLHLNKIPPPMIRARAPEEVEELIMRCLEKDPSKRLSNADEVLDVLIGFTSNAEQRDVPRSLYEKTDTEFFEESPNPTIEIKIPSLFDLEDVSLEKDNDQARFDLGSWTSKSRPKEEKKAVLGSIEIIRKPVKIKRSTPLVPIVERDRRKESNEETPMVERTFMSAPNPENSPSPALMMDILSESTEFDLLLPSVEDSFDPMGAHTLINQTFPHAAPGMGIMRPTEGTRQRNRIRSKVGAQKPANVDVDSSKLLKFPDNLPVPSLEEHSVDAVITLPPSVLTPVEETLVASSRTPTPPVRDPKADIPMLKMPERPAPEPEPEPAPEPETKSSGLALGLGLFILIALAAGLAHNFGFFDGLGQPAPEVTPAPLDQPKVAPPEPLEQPKVTPPEVVVPTAAPAVAPPPDIEIAESPAADAELDDKGDEADPPEVTPGVAPADPGTTAPPNF